MTSENLLWIGVVAVTAFMLWSRLAGKVPAAEARRQDAAGARLLDVRSRGEFAGGHIEGAVNIPLDELDQRAAELGPVETGVVVYCLSGARSGRAAGLLKARGYTNVADLGPMSRW